MAPSLRTRPCSPGGRACLAALRHIPSQPRRRHGRVQRPAAAAARQQVCQGKQAGGRRDDQPFAGWQAVCGRGRKMGPQEADEEWCTLERPQRRQAAAATAGGGRQGQAGPRRLVPATPPPCVTIKPCCAPMAPLSARRASAPSSECLRGAHAGTVEVGRWAPVLTRSADDKTARASSNVLYCHRGSTLPPPLLAGICRGSLPLLSHC